ncbi:MAG: DUF3857 domain-containing protein [Bacteroidales bacterium]|nr:DUF3857 domain-containing protein [Bacteroidales bacterium]
MKNTLLILLFYTLIFNSQSQDTISTISLDSLIGSHEYGNITDFEKELTFCDFDSSAKGVVLFRSGIIMFDYKNGLRLYIHERIKILDNSATSFASIEIPYSSVHDIRAASINYDDDGNEIRTKLESEDIIELEYSYKFAIPNVKKGSIIEYSYLYKSSRFREVTWRFQTSIPTLESEIEIYTGVYRFDFSPIMLGEKLIAAYNGKSVNHWKLINMPAITKEPYAANSDDYTEQIIFKASGYYKSLPYYSTTSNRGFVEHHQTWEQIAESVMDDPEFKSFRPHKKFAKNILNTVIQQGDSDSIKMIKIYDFVRKQYEWNNITKSWLYHKFYYFKATKKGNSAEINLFLVILLRNAGLKAHAALLSTRNNGRIIDEIPLLSQFNQMLVFVEIDNKKYFLNATNPHRPYYMLNQSDYHKKALILDEGNIRWEPLPKPLPKRLVVQTHINVKTDSAIYNFKIKFENQLALHFINELDNQNILSSIKNYTKEKFSKHENTHFNWVKISDNKVTREPIIIEFELAIPMEDMENGNFYSLNPNTYVSWATNPFVSINRQLPVDFYSPIYTKYIVSITTTDDLSILNDAQSQRFILPLEGGYYSGSVVKQSDQKIMMISTMNLKKDIYYTDEYLTLREIIMLMIDFEQQDIVIQEN